ncbi:zincin-like metallopeptidase domain-containing protein [Tabrizicola sp.]
MRHADYICSWLDVLRQDNRAIIRAASQTSKVTGVQLSDRPCL